MRNPLIFLILLMTVVPALVFAQQKEDTEALNKRITTHVSVSDLLEYAYQQNPMIQMARQNWRAVAENYRVATAYPDPQLMITYFPQPIETRLGPQDWNATLTQMLPFPGKLSKIGELVETDARIARLNLDKTVRDITVSILESFHELRYIRQAKQIAEQNSELLAHLRKLGETAYAQDKTAFTDVVKAQSQTAQLQYDMLLLDELAQTEITRINGLLNRPADAPVGVLEPFSVYPISYTPEELYEMAEAAQEELRIADVQAEKADIQTELSRYQNLPEFRVGIFYASIGSPDVSMPPENAGDDAIGIQFGVNIPLWRGKNEGRIEKANAEAEKIRAEKTARILETRTKIRNLFFRLQNARRLISLYKDELIPRAFHAAQTAETWFKAGEGSFSDFAETQAALYNFQLSLARADADYGKYLARLEQLIGQKLGKVK